MTADQARQLADSFNSFATKISQYIKANAQTLSGDEIYVLVKKIGDLHTASAGIQTVAVKIDLSNARTSLEDLLVLTNKGQNAISSIAEIGNVINLLTSVVVLAGSIAAEDPAGAINGLVAVKDAIDTLTNPPA